MRWKHPWHTCLPFASFMFLQRFQSTSSLIYNCTDTVKLANINIVKQHTVLSIITFYGLLRLIHYQYKLFHICCDMDPAWSAQLLCHRHLHVAYRLLQRWHYHLLGKNFLRDDHSVHKNKYLVYLYLYGIHESTRVRKIIFFNPGNNVYSFGSAFVRTRKWNERKIIFTIHTSWTIELFSIFTKGWILKRNHKKEWNRLKEKTLI